MKIDVQFIDHNGFIHFKTGKNKKLVNQWLNSLKRGTEIQWKNPKQLFVSQQYIR